MSLDSLYAYGRVKEPTVPIKSIYEASETQKFRLGTIFETNDGRLFRYAKAGAVALDMAYMGQAQAPTANHENIAVGGTAAIGDKSVEIATTLGTALVKDEYAEGFFWINDADAEGNCHKVKGNDAGTTGTIILYDPLIEALLATSEFSLVRNLWNGVIIAPTTKTAAPVGVPLCDVTAAYYYWAQTRGPAPVKVDTGDTLIIGSPAGQPGTWADAGAIGVVANDGTCNVWGIVLSASAATETALIDLCLD